MGIGDMVGGLMGGDSPLDGIMEKISASGVDLSALGDLDAEGITAMLADNGVDLSMLEGLGISVDDIIAKVTGNA